MDEYYHIFTDVWRLFRTMLNDPDRFSYGWWERWVAENNALGKKYPGRFTRDLINAMTGEMERIKE